MSLAALGACSSAAGRAESHPFVSRFEAAIAFVPSGMDSLWLTDVRGVEWREGSAEAALHRDVRCGRDHESPRGWRYNQTFDGVLVEDYAPGGVPAARRESLGQESTPMDSYPIWHRPERTEGLGQIVPATWSTVVDERFVVIADSEDLLRAALSRPRGAIAEKMLASMDVPADAVEVVYHGLRQPWVLGDKAMTGDWIGMLVAATPPRVEWWGFKDEPQTCAGATPVAHRMHGNTPVWLQLVEPPVAENLAGCWLSIALVFGLIVLV